MCPSWKRTQTKAHERYLDAGANHSLKWHIKQTTSLGAKLLFNCIKNDLCLSHASPLDLYIVACEDFLFTKTAAFQLDSARPRCKSFPRNVLALEEKGIRKCDCVSRFDWLHLHLWSSVVKLCFSSSFKTCLDGMNQLIGWTIPNVFMALNTRSTNWRLFTLNDLEEKLRLIDRRRHC